MFHLSEPISLLQEELNNKDDRPSFDAIVVGSGYGGAVAAARLAEAGFKVLLLERGKEYLPGEFPNNFSEAPSHVRFESSARKTPWGYEDALLDLRFGPQTGVLMGNGLGGGSQINANVALEPDMALFDSAKGWPQAISQAASNAGLRKYFSKVREVIGITDLSIEQAKKLYPKARALASLGGDAPSMRVRESTPIAVKIKDLPYQSAQPDGCYPRRDCSGCGNCVTGCNYGAKGTLTTNYLPIAKKYGARLVTGATVLCVEKVDEAWQITGIPTSQRTRLRKWEERYGAWSNASDCNQLKSQFFKISAKTLILSAGTFGTAEIMQRSIRGRNPIKCSSQLGKHFSGNGDYFAFSYAQRGRAVNTIGWANEEDCDTPVGPTITATLEQKDTAGKSKFIIQDGAIPSALAPALREVWALANAASLDEKSAPFDAVALDQRGATHTQTFLGMGIDKANGGLVRDHKTGRVHVEWPTLDAADEYQQYGGDIRDALKEASRKAGGTYIDNPAWKPLPAHIETLIDTGSGKKTNAPSVKQKNIRGVNLISHPLGGCAMADSVHQGVVNDIGAVFSGLSATHVNRGLFILDGSILRGAVGVNPFLTIAALAERAIETIIAGISPNVPEFTDEGNPVLDPPEIYTRLDIPQPFSPRRPAGISLSEVLRGGFEFENPKQKADAALELTFFSNDVDSWLQQTKQRFAVDPRSALRIKTSAIPHAPVAQYRPHGKGSHITVLAPPAAATCTARLVVFVAAYVLYPLSKWVTFLQRMSPIIPKLIKAGLSSRQVATLLYRAYESRAIEYHLEMQSDDPAICNKMGLPPHITLVGYKDIAHIEQSWKDKLLALRKAPYRNPMRMFSEPALQIWDANEYQRLAQGTRFRMDYSDMTHRTLPQILGGDTSQGLLKLFAYPLAFMRFTVRNLLLDLRIPRYEKDEGLGPANESVVEEQTANTINLIKRTHSLPQLASRGSPVRPMLYAIPE
ncbi:MAG: GMC family oxidoreductase N-terminal domain-containing protein, partial [Burkholderiales bacterium]